MDILKILNRWFDFTKYDPDQTKFNLLDGEYQLHRANEQIKMLFNEYDRSGSLAVMYAKTIFEQYLMEKKISIYEMLSDPDSLSEYQAAWDIFHSDEVASLENTYMDAFDTLIRTISKSEFIGERNRDSERKTIFNSIDRVVDSIAKLQFDVYKNNNPIGEIKMFSTTISVFPTLAQCVLTLEAAADGMYLCYISMGDTSDGYFGYFIKSNGTVCSINERPNEAFPGQHVNSRNGRWSEQKAYAIFPYEAAFSFGNYDYKGYSSVHKIDKDKIDFFSLGADVYFPIVLSMLMLSQKYSGKSIQEPIVFIDSLLDANVSRMIECVSDKSLIPVETSAIVKVNKQLLLPFTQKDVMAGTYGRHFNYKNNKDKPYYETGTFPEQDENSYSQLLIDLYGDGFTLDVNKLLVSDSCMRMLPAQCDDMECSPVYGEKSDCEYNTNNICQGKNVSHFNVEFVGSQGRMEMEAYRQARNQLADHIKANMLYEYKIFGGADEVLSWWRNELENHREEIINRFVGLYIENKVAEMTAPDVTNQFGNTIAKSWVNNHRGTFVKLENKENLMLCCCPDTKSSSLYEGYDRINLSKCEKIKTKSGRTVEANFDICEVSGGKCSIYFTFTPSSWKDIEIFIGKNVPKILKGWKKNSDFFQTGNPLLSATDSVPRIKTPLGALMEHRDCAEYEKLGLNKHHFTLNFGIGFSKSGFKKLVKSYYEKNKL